MYLYFFYFLLFLLEMNCAKVISVLINATFAKEGTTFSSFDPFKTYGKPEVLNV